MVTLLVGGSRGLVALREGPAGWGPPGHPGSSGWLGSVYALAAMPGGGAIFAGTDAGLLRSLDGGVRWERVLGREVRALLLDPRHPGRLYAGAQPAAAWRSDDGGESWRELRALGTPAERAGWHLPGDTPLATVPIARVGALVPDPAGPDALYAAIEIGGVWHSDDGGRGWQARNAGLASRDVHLIAPHPREPATAFAATEAGVYRTIDRGARWTRCPLDAGAGYTRALAILPPIEPALSPRLLAGPASVHPWGWGDDPGGARCRLLRSDDDGASWSPLGSAHGLPDRFAGLISVLVADPADPRAAWLGTWDGRAYRTRDRGERWEEIGAALGDIWSLCPLPDV